MLINPPPKHRSRGRRILDEGSSPSPAALVLVSATFDPDGPEVYLVFDRAIDIAGIVASQFIVRDEPNGHRLVGFQTPILIDPMQVQVVLTIIGAESGADVLLTVGAGNGIIAVDDGGAWAGAADLSLPWP